MAHSVNLLRLRVLALRKLAPNPSSTVLDPAGCDAGARARDPTPPLEDAYTRAPAQNSGVMESAAEPEPEPAGMRTPPAAGAEPDPSKHQQAAQAAGAAGSSKVVPVRGGQPGRLSAGRARLRTWTQEEPHVVILGEAHLDCNAFGESISKGADRSLSVCPTTADHGRARCICCCACIRSTCRCCYSRIGLPFETEPWPAFPCSISSSTPCPRDRSRPAEFLGSISS